VELLLSLEHPADGQRKNGGVGEPWNVNIHYDRRLADSVPDGARSVLDVGCGDGFLAARIADRVPGVVALDIDAPVLARARARFPDTAVTWREGDLLDDPFPVTTFDAVVSNATLHHFADAGDALGRLAALVGPGGTLAVVGLVRTGWRDVPWAVMAALARGIAHVVRGRWEHTAPQRWPPPHTFGELRKVVAEVLPDARLARLLLGRYLLTWQAPG
jgi:SAM-dependent methyltransferase